MATGPTDWEKQNKDKAASAFDRARSGQTMQKPEKVNSQQVAKTAPGMNGPAPPQNAKNAMARQSHNKDMAKDDKAASVARAKELQKGALEKQTQQQRERSKGEKER